MVIMVFWFNHFLPIVSTQFCLQVSHCCCWFLEHFWRLGLAKHLAPWYWSYKVFKRLCCCWFQEHIWRLGLGLAKSSREQLALFLHQRAAAALGRGKKYNWSPFSVFFFSKSIIGHLFFFSFVQLVTFVCFFLLLYNLKWLGWMGWDILWVLENRWWGL